jgi:T5orf172 domain
MHTTNMQYSRVESPSVICSPDASSTADVAPHLYAESVPTRETPDPDEFGVTDLLPSTCLACGSRLGVRYPSGWLCAICEWRYGEQPDPEFAPPRVDVVYYLRFADRIKIGTSGNPRRRLAQLKHDKLLAFERGGRETEQRRHAQFAQDRYARTEWFRMSPPLLAHIATLRVGEDSPWNNYHLWLSQAIALR